MEVETWEKKNVFLVIPVKEILICLPIHYTTAWKEEVCFVLFLKKNSVLRERVRNLRETRNFRTCLAKVSVEFCTSSETILGGPNTSNYLIPISHLIYLSYYCQPACSVVAKYSRWQVAKYNLSSIFTPLL